MTASQDQILTAALETRKDKEVLGKGLKIINYLKRHISYGENPKFQGLKQMLENRDNIFSGLKAQIERLKYDIKTFEDLLKVNTEQLSKHYEGLTTEKILEIVQTAYNDNTEIDKRLLEILEKENSNPFGFYWRYPDGDEPFVWSEEYPTEDFIPKHNYEDEIEWTEAKQTEERRCDFVGTYKLFTMTDLINSYKAIKDSLQSKESELAELNRKIEARQKTISSIEQKLKEKFGNRLPDILERNGIKVRGIE